MTIARRLIILAAVTATVEAKTADRPGRGVLLPQAIGTHSAKLDLVVADLKPMAKKPLQRVSL